MGMDYSYRLYFAREDLWDALQGVAVLSRPAALPTIITFPDHLRSYSIEAWGEKKRFINHDEPQFGFVVSMYFQQDEEILQYLKRVSPEHLESLSTASPLGAAIGCIYINVYNDLNLFEDKKWDTDLVLIDFGTPGSTMSILFFESVSIRNRFIELLEKHKGVCGVLNLEDSGWVIWLDGKPVDRRIPDPYMSPEEIREYLKSNPVDEE